MSDVDNIGTHKRFCSLENGCKYGDSNCLVASGKIKQLDVYKEKENKLSQQSIKALKSLSNISQSSFEDVEVEELKCLAKEILKELNIK